MSLWSLLNQQVTIVRPAQGLQGYDFGPAADRRVTQGRLERGVTNEETIGFPATSPDVSVTEWVLFLRPGEVLGPVDRIEQGSAVFEVVGHPEAVYGRRGVHHLEVRLRSVEGDHATALQVT